MEIIILLVQSDGPSGNMSGHFPFVYGNQPDQLFNKAIRTNCKSLGIKAFWEGLIWPTDSIGHHHNQLDQSVPVDVQHFRRTNVRIELLGK